MSPPIRVLHIITRLVRGGAQGVMLDMLKGLDRSRFEPMLIAGEQTGAEGSLWEDARTLDIPIHICVPLVREIAPLKDYAAYREIRRVIRTFQPDVVHSHTSKAGLLGSAAARHENVGCVVLAPHGHIGRNDARIPGVPDSGMKRWLLVEAQRRSCDYADVVIAPNDAELQDGIDLGLWDPDSALTVPNGVDTERFHPDWQESCRLRRGYTRDRYRVGVIARLTSEKGIDIALHAMAFLHEDVHLVVCGDGPERPQLERLTATLGIEHRVRFLGMVDNIDEWLPAFDACWVPSRTEAHGMVAAEAMASGIPVVASDVGGLRSLVEHERTGLLVEVGNVGGFAAATVRLQSSPDFAERLSSRGRQHVEQNFSNKVMIDRVSEVYTHHGSPGAVAELSS